MSQQIGKLQTLTGGISTISNKLGPPNSFAWGRSIDFRSDPAQQTTYPQAKKISGSIVTDLPMFADVAGSTLYFHGNTGNIYSVNTSDMVTKEYTVPNSSGNGIVFFSETQQLYISTNTSITRKDIATGNYYDTFLETEGGSPTNLNALLLVAMSSQSATRASTASLQLSGDMTLEAYLKPTTLPTGTNKMSIISKWDESGAKLGYKLDIVTTSGAFADGSDGALSNSTVVTDAPIDSSATGTINTNALTATNASFVPGQYILIHQTRGTGAGTFQKTKILSYTAGTITTADPLNFSYLTDGGANCAQVLVRKRYSTGSITGTINAKKWNGVVGGIISYLFNTSIGGTGNINADGAGFRGGTGNAAPAEGQQGESEVKLGGNSASANGTGAGGGGDLSGNGVGGGTSGQNDLTVSMNFGGGGGGTNTYGGHTPQNGGAGGGIVDIESPSWSGSLTITAQGVNPSLSDAYSASGSGAGGSVFLVGQTLPLSSYTIQAVGGGNNGSTNSASGQNGAGGGHATAGQNASNNASGAGGNGYVHIDYLTSYTAPSTPTLYATQDNNLGIANGYALQLYISSDGSTFETYTQNIDNFIGVYKFYSVSWKASTSTAIFYENAQPIGTKVGTKTSINQNTAIFGIGCYVNSSSAKTGFYDGLIDDVRIWNAVRTPAQIANYYNIVLSGGETNLVAYYPFDGNVNDLQVSTLNSLTANNAPTYSSDVAFKGVTTRGDEDVSLIEAGQLYTLKTALSETATDKIPFVPTKEPFKSLALNIDTVGTGNLTVTVHDELNNVVTTLTVAHADVRTGIYEFKFANSKRIVLNANYHIHVFDTTGDGKVVTHTISDLSTAYLKTYFQILVNDTYHQAVQFQNFVCIANERYLAILQAGNVYNPARLIFPSGYRIRSLAFWQQYIVIGMWFGNNITDTDTGKLFFWDGESDTYIDALDIPQGGINAMHGTQGGLLISAGYKGAMLEYTGYPSSFRYTARTAAQLAFRLPNVAEGDTVEIAPGALTMWNTMNRIGLSLNTNSTTIHQGIYTYGQYIDSDPMSVGFDYPLAFGDTTSSSVKIGCLFARNSKLYAGWQNNGTYGIDVIDENTAPCPTATLEFLITDLGSVAAKKLPLVFRTDFLPLVSGQSVSLKYKPDRASNWIPLGTQSTVGASDIRTTINQRVKEVQLALDIVNTTQSVTFLQHTLESEAEEDSRQT